ncbi:MAG: transglutaminase domain-containing protein [Verrucomicrobiales bacterium]|nr:transglutaminase domain-containing protein [Verrucomicrobiales bacterium]
MNTQIKTLLIASLISAGALRSHADPSVILPDFKEDRTVALTQTVYLKEIPEGTKELRMWVPVPTDRNWQRVLNLKVESAPGEWKIVPQANGAGDFVYAEVKNPAPGETRVQISCVVERVGVHFPLENTLSGASFQPQAFGKTLDTKVPLMGADHNATQLANEACGEERDLAKQSMLLLKKVSEVADHYSKDPTKPHCGIGSAEDCMNNGGGCCTDLHSLFISMARARQVPSRMQYGYRLLDGKEGSEYNPGYRCWVEYFVPGAGWVPTDIVAADNADESNPYRWSSLSPYRVWLWEGRSFELTPEAAAGPIDTMTCGWAEIDGKPVNPLPFLDGSPSNLTRTVSYKILTHNRPENSPKLPE